VASGPYILELSGLTWHVPAFITNRFIPCRFSGQIDWHAIDRPGTPVLCQLFRLAVCEARTVTFCVNKSLQIQKLSYLYEEMLSSVVVTFLLVQHLVGSSKLCNSSFFFAKKTNNNWLQFFLTKRQITAGCTSSCRTASPRRLVGPVVKNLDQITASCNHVFRSDRIAASSGRTSGKKSRSTYTLV